MLDEVFYYLESVHARWPWLGPSLVAFAMGAFLCGCSVHGAYQESASGARVASFDANLFRRTDTAWVASKGDLALEVPVGAPLQRLDVADSPPEAGFPTPRTDGDQDVVEAQHFEIVAENGFAYVTRDHEVSEDAAKLGRSAILAGFWSWVAAGGVGDFFSWLGGL